mmetsp:Transcript_48978/g.156661  ORF Transcript_48978/g.156661 Transcript_48978/m.156661 type:complete len:685 (-) Transcript_48978:179-2233(-)
MAELSTTGAKLHVPLGPLIPAWGEDVVRAGRGSGRLCTQHSSCSRSAAGNTSPPQFFVRRTPEEYSRLEPVESTITTSLRKQAGCEDGQQRGSFHLARVGPPLQHPYPGRIKTLEVRVHLPPYNGTDSVIAIAAPTTMCVADLREEIIRQHAGHASVPFEACELRLYDEVEQEPDYDCPAFDRNLRIGSLTTESACVVALCPVAPAQGTPPSPPLSHPCLKAQGLSPQDATPRALGSLWAGGAGLGGLLQPCMREARGRGSPGRSAARPLAASVPAASPGSGTPLQVPRASQGASSACREAPLAAEAELASGRPRRKTWESEAGARQRQHFSHSRAKSLPEHVITFGGFEGLAEVAEARQPDEAAAVASCSTQRLLQLTLADGAARPVPPPALSFSAAEGAAEAPLGPPLGTDQCVGTLGTCDGGERVAISTTEEATLLEVLEQLSRECGRHYDPVHFAIVRFEDGIQQLLDLNMQVKHLQQCSSALTVVRKNALLPFPTADSLFSDEDLEDPMFSSSHQQLTSIRRPSVSAFFFNEYSASIATRYLVTAAVPGARSGPVECTLVVDGERLYHQALRGSQAPERRNQQRRESRMIAPLKKLGKRFQHSRVSHTEPRIFAERCVRDICSVSLDESHQRAFSVVYSEVDDRGAGPECSVELLYQAQTPTKCAEIVARLHFLLTLEK